MKPDSVKMEKDACSKWVKVSPCALRFRLAGRIMAIEEASLDVFRHERDCVRCECCHGNKSATL